MDVVLGLAQVLLVLAVFWLPGTLVAWAAGARGLLAWALAPAVTLAVFGSGAFGASLLGLRWTLVLAVPVTVVVAGGLHLLVARRWRAQPVRVSGGMRPALLLPLVAGSVLVQLVPVHRATLSRGQVGPALSFDPAFHLALLQYVRTHPFPTPLRLGALVDPTQPGFYPWGWHAVAGTVPVLLDRTSLLAAASYAVAAVAFTLGCALAARVLLPGRRVEGWAVVLAASGLAYAGQLVLTVGVTPCAVGLSLVPGVTAATVLALRPGVGRCARLVAGLGWLGVWLCHQAPGVGLLALSAPWLAAGLVRWWRAAGRGRRWAAAAALVVTAAAGVTFLVVDPTLRVMGSIWSPDTPSVPVALRDLALGSPSGSAGFAVVAVALAVVGAVGVARRGPDRLLLVSLAVAVLLFTLTSLPQTWAHTLTSPFYAEGRRVSTLVGGWSVLLAAAGADDLARAVARRVELTSARAREAVGLGVAGALAVVAAAMSLAVCGTAVQTAYRPVGGPPAYLSDAQVQMLGAQVRRLPTGAVVLGADHTAVSQLYGRWAVRTQPFYTGPLPADLSAALRAAAGGRVATVCSTLRAHGVTHVLLVGRVAGLRPAGLALLGTSGDVALYAVTGCPVRPAASA